jgi:acetylornithine aminotransferase
MLGGFKTVAFNDLDATRAAVSSQTCAILLEVVEGESGVHIADQEFVQGIRKICDERGILMMVDEIQTGVGRTGEWFAFQAEGVEPDVITLAKGLGGGLPIGAALAFGPAADLLTPGQHGSTFGGNPVSCAAGLAVLDTLAADDVLANVKRVGARLREGIAGLGHPLVDHVRGAGLLLGVVLTDSVAPRVQQAAQDAGLLVNAVAPDVIRLAPPLIIGEDVADALVRALPGVLDAARGAY